MSTRIATSREYGIHFASDHKQAHTIPYHHESKHDIDDEMENEESNAYIPLSVARAKMKQLTKEMQQMKSAHLELIDHIHAKYDVLTRDSRSRYEELTNEIKARATTKIRENKILIESLEQELMQLKSKQDEKLKDLINNTTEYTTAKDDWIATEQQHLTRISEHESQITSLQEEIIKQQSLLQEEKTNKEQLEQQIQTLKQQHEQEIQTLNQQTESKLQSLHEARDSAIASITAEKDATQQEMNNINQQHAQQMKETLDQHTQQMNTLKDEHDAIILRMTEEKDVAITEALQQAAASVGSSDAPTSQDGKLALAIEKQKKMAVERKLALLEKELAKRKAVASGRDIEAEQEMLQRIRNLENQINKLQEDNFRLVSATGADMGETKGEEKIIEEEMEVDEPVGDGEGAQRARLEQTLSQYQSELDSLNTQITNIDKPLRQQHVETKERQILFKTKETRWKELHDILHFNTLKDDAGNEKKLTVVEWDELTNLLNMSTRITEERKMMANKLKELQTGKAEMDTMRTRMSTLKDEIMAMRGNSDSNPTELKSKEDEFNGLKPRVLDMGNMLKNNKSLYETELAGFKERDAQVQTLLIKYNLDADAGDGKPRKLVPSIHTQLEEYLTISRTRNEERDTLKSMADHVNRTNAELKSLKMKRDELNTKIEALKQQISGMVGGPVVTQKVKKMVKRTVKMSSSGSKPTPIEPYVPRTSIIVASSQTSQPTVDPIQTKLQTMETQYHEMKRQSVMYQQQMIELTQTSKQTESEKEQELQTLKQQLSILTASEGVDATLQALSQQLEKERINHQTLLSQQQQHEKEIQQQLMTCRVEVMMKQEMIESLRKEMNELEKSLELARLYGTGDDDESIQQAAQREISGQGEIKSGPIDPDVASLRNELKKAKYRIKEVEIDMVQLQKAAGSKELPIMANDDIRIMKQEHSTLSQKIDELESQLQTTTQGKSQLEQQVVMLQQQCQQLQSEAVQHSANLAGAASKDMEAKMTALNEEYAQRIQTLQTTMSQMEQNLNNMTTENTRLKGCETELNDLKVKSEEWQKTAAQADAKVTKLKEEVKTKTELSTQLETSLTETKKELEWTHGRLIEENKRRKDFQFKYEDVKGKIRVYARVRPFSKKEIADKETTLLRAGKNEWTLELNETERDVMGNVKDKWREFAFDHVFHFGLDGVKGNASQAQVFEETQQFAELSCAGINTCVFAYGQSGTGKTFTMAGIKPSEDNGMTKDLLGLKPRMIDRVYQIVEENKANFDYTVSCYMVEIYLNELQDLFYRCEAKQKYAGWKKEKIPPVPELIVRCDSKTKKVMIENIMEKSFPTAAEMHEFTDAAELVRRVRKTGLNEASSRSHLIFAISIEATDKKTGKKTKGKLSLVDLAGSERADKTNVDGLSKTEREAMLAEGIAINESLRMLKNVFRILGTAHLPVKKGAKAEVVQYRGNMLTEVMQDSLGGNAKTLMFVNVGPAASNISESIDSLQYGDFVKNITNEKASADEDFTEQIRRMRLKLNAYEQKFGAIPDPT